MLSYIVKILSLAQIFLSYLMVSFARIWASMCIAPTWSSRVGSRPFSKKADVGSTANNMCSDIHSPRVYSMFRRHPGNTPEKSVSKMGQILRSKIHKWLAPFWKGKRETVYGLLLDGWTFTASRTMRDQGSSIKLPFGWRRPEGDINRMPPSPRKDSESFIWANERMLPIIKLAKNPLSIGDSRALKCKRIS
jgi:hypothetical protein